MLSKSRYLTFTLDVILPILVLIAMGFGVWVVLYSHVFAIKQVVCQSDFRPCENGAVVAEANKELGNNIFRYDGDSLKAKLMSGDYMLSGVTITKHLPGTLEVELVSVNPSFALVLTTDNSSYVVCDQAGRVIGTRAEDPNVPLVQTTYLPVLRIGQVIPDQDLLQAGKLALALRQINIQATDLTLGEDGLVTLHLPSGLKVIMTTKSEGIDKELDTLQQALSDTTIKQEGKKTLDLRFAQPILKQN